jgi:hypothetical protein
MTRRKPRSTVQATCADPKCGQPFTVQRRWHRFCSDKCRDRVLHAARRRDARNQRQARLAEPRP